jgi:hypothetical protein
MIFKLKTPEPDSERFRFVSDFIRYTAERCNPEHDSSLKQSLQIGLQHIINKEYRPAVCSLRCSVRETQSVAAYLLLAEAYAQSGQTEMALATLDVLRCVKPDRSEAEMMKEFLRQEEDNKKSFRTVVRTRMALRAERNELTGKKEAVVC